MARQRFPSDHRGWFRCLEDILDDPKLNGDCPADCFRFYIRLLAMLQRVGSRDGSIALDRHALGGLAGREQHRCALRVARVGAARKLYALCVEGPRTLITVSNWAKIQGFAPTPLRENAGTRLDETRLDKTLQESRPAASPPPPAAAPISSPHVQQEECLDHGWHWQLSNFDSCPECRTDVERVDTSLDTYEKPEDRPGATTVSVQAPASNQVEIVEPSPPAGGLILYDDPNDPLALVPEAAVKMLANLLAKRPGTRAEHEQFLRDNLDLMAVELEILGQPTLAQLKRLVFRWHAQELKNPGGKLPRYETFSERKARENAEWEPK